MDLPFFICVLSLTDIVGRENNGPALAGPPIQGKTYQFALPDSKVNLVIDLPGFQMGGKVGPAHPYKKIEGINRENGMIITGFFEPLDQRPPVHAPTPQAAREYHYTQGLARRSPLKSSEVRLSESGPMALVDYLIEEYQGRRIMQKNYWAFLVQDNVCIRLHLSKTSFKPGEEQLFSTILSSIRFEAK